MKIPGTNQARQRFIGRLMGTGTPQGIAGSEDPDSLWKRMMAQGSKGSGTSVQRTSTSAASSFPKLEDPSPEDIANGNYVKVGFRHLLRHDLDPSRFAFHTYAGIPVMQNGKQKTGDDGNPQFESYGVLGNPGGSKNQQVRKNDKDPVKWKNEDRNSQMSDHPRYKGEEVKVKVTPEQREALRQGMQYFQADENSNATHPCPVCGSKYHKLGPNSNEFIYNMLYWNPAGPIPAPKPPFPTPAYYRNDPNAQWYPNQTPPTNQK